MLRGEKERRRRTATLPTETDGPDGKLPRRFEEPISCRPEQSNGLGRDELLNQLPEEVATASYPRWNQASASQSSGFAWY
jgi:hypothetical protein